MGRTRANSFHRSCCELFYQNHPYSPDFPAADQRLKFSRQQTTVKDPSVEDVVWTNTKKLHQPRDSPSGQTLPSITSAWKWKIKTYTEIDTDIAKHLGDKKKKFYHHLTPQTKLQLTPCDKFLPNYFVCKNYTHNPRVCVCVRLVAQKCPTLCKSMDCSPTGSSIHGDSSGKSTGVRCHALLPGIFPTQG